MHRPAPLLHNRWFGKALASVIALSWAPPELNQVALYVAVALAVGHLFDEWSVRMLHPVVLARVLKRLRPTGQASEPFLEYLFAALGHVSKHSGQVTEAHIAYVERLMGRLGLVDEARLQAIGWFTAGKAGDYAYPTLTGAQHPQRDSMLELLTECLAACTAIQPRHETDVLVEKLLAEAGADPELLVQARVHPVPERSLPRQAPELVAARQRLGVGSDADVDTIKTAYRRAIAQCHPDKLPPDATDGEREEAAAKTRDLRGALELLTAAAKI